MNFCNSTLFQAFFSTNCLSAPRKGIYWDSLTCFTCCQSTASSKLKPRTNRPSIQVHPSVEPSICGLSADCQNKCISLRGSM